MVMRFIRAQMRIYGAVDLSVPQFRALLFIKRHIGSSLGSVAENLGLTAPSMSKLIEGLNRRGLVERKGSSLDRRKVTIGITTSGDELLDRALDGTEKSLSAAMTTLTTEELRTVRAAMEALKRVFPATRQEAV